MLAGKGQKALAMAVALIAALVLLPACAQAALYWPTSYGLSRSNTDGSEFNYQFIGPGPTGPFAEYDGCEDVSVSASYVYWSEPARGSIARANLDGSGANYDFITGLLNPCGMAVDETSIYWTEEKASRISKANLDGGELERGFIGSPTKPCG